MSWRVAPCLDQLLHEINVLAPHRSKASDGSIGDPAHASRSSDHNPDSRRIVHARDFTHDPAHGADMHVLSLRVIGDRRVKYVIWNHRIWTPEQGWHAYHGTNPHDHHMHVSVKTGQVFENDVSAWLGQEDDMAQVPQEEWDEVKAQIEDLAIAVNKLFVGTFDKDNKKVKAATGRGYSVIDGLEDLKHRLPDPEQAADG